MSSRSTGSGGVSTPSTSLSLPTPTTSATPTSTTPTTSSTTTPTSAATSSTPTSSATTPSASSATTAQSSSSTTTTPLLTSQTVVSSGGVVQTITDVVTPTANSSSTPQNNSTSSNSFFSNTKAVAGVFTVVGLIVAALVIALIVNAVKRRRAKKFDRDVAEAAAEAAASSRSPFDDDSYANTGAGGNGGSYGYSENTPYQVPPLPPKDVYGASEMSQYDPYTAGAASLAAAVAVDRSRSRKESEPGTPGIAGVGARGLAREPSKRAPYHAFAGPQPHELQTSSSGTLRSPRGTNLDILEAVGLTGPPGTATGAGQNPAASNNNNNNVTRRPSETTQNTHFSGRSQFGSMNSHHPTPLQPGYPVDSYYPQRPDSLSPDPFAAAGYRPPVSVSTTTLPNPHDVALPSPSPPGNQSDHNEDPAELGSSTALRSEEPRMSYQDDTDYSQGNRILRVANE